MPRITCQELRTETGACLDLKPGSGALAAHLEACLECRAWQEDLLRIRGALEALPEPALPAGFEEGLLARLEGAVVAPTVLDMAWKWLRRTVAPRRMVVTGGLVGALLVLGFPTLVEVPTVAPGVQQRASPTASPVAGVEDPVDTHPVRAAEGVASPDGLPLAGPAPAMEPIPLERAHGDPLYQALVRAPPALPLGDPLHPHRELAGIGDATGTASQAPLAFDPAGLARSSPGEVAVPPPIMAVEPLNTPNDSLQDAVLEGLPVEHAPHHGFGGPGWMHGGHEHMHSLEGMQMGMHGEHESGHMDDGPMH